MTLLNLLVFNAILMKHLMCHKPFFLWVMLTSNFRALVKNPVKESFDITFMGNEKSYQNINCFFFLVSHKNFL